jgi:hypothetical protein
MRVGLLGSKRSVSTKPLTDIFQHHGFSVSKMARTAKIRKIGTIVAGTVGIVSGLIAGMAIPF